MASRQLVVFNIGDEEFGVDIGYVNSIERPLEIFKIPNTPEYVEGLINLRGKVYTVINLRKRFNLPAREFDENTKIIIVTVNSVTVGFIVDTVSEIIRIDDENVENAPSVLTGARKRFINSVAKVDDRILILIDLNTVISSSEESNHPSAPLQPKAASN